jgi:type IV pilus assembly protein PilC
MPSFVYKALDNSGNELKGTYQASDMNNAAQELRARGLRVIEVKQKRGKTGFLGEDNFSDWYASQRSVSPSALIFFFRQLSFMLRSGLPVADALDLAQVQVSSPRLKLVIRKMLKAIRNGQALSKAMSQQKSIFPEMAINLIMAGESTGDLDSIMERIAVHLEKKAALKAQMINAMIYPVIVVLAAIGVSTFMIVKIIPEFSKFLLKQGKPLPASTQALIDLSQYVRDNGVLIIVISISVIISVLVFYQFKFGRKTIDSLILRLPVFGPLVVTGTMAQMTWALSTLLRSGVTVFDALKITSNLLNNRIYSNKLHDASDLIMSGRDIASSIQHKQMPPLVLQMISVGESSGSLDRVLQELGTYYERLLEIAIKRLSAMIEPAMILVIGGMVGFVYYAFFQALFSLTGG